MRIGLGLCRMLPFAGPRWGPCLVQGLCRVGACVTCERWQRSGVLRMALVMGMGPSRLDRVEAEAAGAERTHYRRSGPSACQYCVCQSSHPLLILCTA